MRGGLLRSARSPAGRQGPAPASLGVRFCARANDCRALGAFLCNSKKLPSPVEDVGYYPYLIRIITYLALHWFASAGPRQ
jgi:hypothetical protein